MIAAKRAAGRRRCGALPDRSRGGAGELRARASNDSSCDRVRARRASCASTSRHTQLPVGGRRGRSPQPTAPSARAARTHSQAAAAPRRRQSRATTTGLAVARSQPCPCTRASSIARGRGARSTVSAETQTLGRIDGNGAARPDSAGRSAVHGNRRANSSCPTPVAGARPSRGRISGTSDTFSLDYRLKPYSTSSSSTWPSRFGPRFPAQGTTGRSDHTFARSTGTVRNRSVDGRTPATPETLTHSVRTTARSASCPAQSTAEGSAP